MLSLHSMTGQNHNQIEILKATLVHISAVFGSRVSLIEHTQMLPCLCMYSLTHWSTCMITFLFSLYSYTLTPWPSYSITHLYSYQLVCLPPAACIPSCTHIFYMLTLSGTNTVTYLSAHSPFYLCSHIHNYILWPNYTLWPTYICPDPDPVEPQLQRHPIDKGRELDCREARLSVTFPAARPALMPGSCLLPASSCKSPSLHVWQLPTYFLWSEHLCVCRVGRKASHSQGTYTFPALHVVPCVYAPPRLFCSWPGGLTRGGLGWVRADRQVSGRWLHRWPVRDLLQGRALD